MACFALAVLLAIAGCSAERPASPTDRQAPTGPFARLIQLFLSDTAERERLETLARAEAAAERPPYVTIRFDRPRVVFEDALYVALTKALDRYPDSRFDVVLAIPPLPVRANPREALARGERQIEDVVLAMTDMGMPSDRLTISAHTDEAADVNEIRIFVR